MAHLKTGPRQAADAWARALVGGTLGLLVFGAVLAGPAPALAQGAGAKPGGEHGETTAKEATQVDLSAIRALSVEEAAKLLPPPEPRGNLTEEQFEARKEAAAKAPTAAAVGPVAPAPTAVGRATPAANFVFRAQSESGSVTPSDMALAISPSYIVQVVNSSIAVYNKSAGWSRDFQSFLAHSFRAPQEIWETLGRFTIGNLGASWWSSTISREALCIWRQARPATPPALGISTHLLPGARPIVEPQGALAQTSPNWASMTTQFSLG